MISDNIRRIISELPPTAKLVAVSKFQTAQSIMEAYSAGQRLFGENRPQELMSKATTLPKDISWHFIGNLQSNKIKMVVPYTSLIHSISSEKLLHEVDEYCLKNGYHTDVLLEMHIASEQTKQGFVKDEVLEMIDRMHHNSATLPKCLRLRGVMGMASFTDDQSKIRSEFASLTYIFDTIVNRGYSFLTNFNEKSFGMSDDYKIAIEMGATLVRIGTNIFGPRDYSK